MASQNLPTVLRPWLRLIKTPVEAKSRQNLGCRKIPLPNVWGHWLRSTAATFLLIFLFHPCLSSSAQEPIVLRDLSVLHDQKIIEFDQSMIHLSDGHQLGWDEILSATVDGERQADFNQNITQIGLPLFRLKYRMSLGDWSGAGELAEPLYRKLQWNGLTTNAGDSYSNYLICVATMKARIRAGNRATAVLPFLQAAKIQQTVRGDATKYNLLPDTDIESLLSSEILPIWFNQRDAETAFDQLANAFVPTSATQDIGAIVYLTALAVKVNRFDLAKDLLNLIEIKDPIGSNWRTVLQAQLMIEQGNPVGAAAIIDQKKRTLHDAPALVSVYLRNAELFSESDHTNGRTKTFPIEEVLDENRATEGMLELLQIPAFQGQLYPELAAAAVFQAAQIARKHGWKSESDVLRRELLFRYPNSYHAGLLKE